MSRLYLVHIEDTFRRLFPRGYVDDLVEFLKQWDGWVTAAVSYINDDRPIQEILPYIGQEFEWSWGYQPECFREDEQGWVIPSYGHEWTWVPPELRQLNGSHKIHVGGGYRAECLQDFLCCLDFLELDYTVEHELVY